jgi:enediyne biosynthesis protein E5
MLTYGVTALDFEQTPFAIACILASALTTQWLCGRIVALPAFDPLSATATALSLSLLLRASSPWILALAASLAIASKFTLRVDGKHVFNPSNFSIAILLLFTDVAWISPAQWGSSALFIFFFAGLASLALTASKRLDIALSFIVSYATMLLARAFYLGDPLTIPMREMQSGALLVFAFFMITDPKTTPDARAGRIVYAALVAAIAIWLQYWRYMPQGLMYALFFASPLVPLIDRLTQRFRGQSRFEWTRPVVN